MVSNRVEFQEKRKRLSSIPCFKKNIHKQLDTPSKILFHQIRVIDAERIIEPIGKILSPQVQGEIEDKIRLTFAL